MFWQATDRESRLNHGSSKSDLKRPSSESRTKCKSRPVVGGRSRRDHSASKATPRPCLGGKEILSLSSSETRIRRNPEACVYFRAGRPASSVSVFPRARLVPELARLWSYIRALSLSLSHESLSPSCRESESPRPRTRVARALSAPADRLCDLEFRSCLRVVSRRVSRRVTIESVLGKPRSVRVVGTL